MLIGIYSLLIHMGEVCRNATQGYRKGIVICSKYCVTTAFLTTAVFLLCKCNEVFVLSFTAESLNNYLVEKTE